jgi:ethanolamine ammonia-lyase large subunit
MMSRRNFLHGLGSTATVAGLVSPRCLQGEDAGRLARIPAPNSDEDVFAFIRRVYGSFDTKRYAQILGAANDFKEGDEISGLAAGDETSRRNARSVLGNTRLADISDRPVYSDELQKLISPQPSSKQSGATQTLNDLKQFLLTADESKIKAVMPGLSSDVISGVVKLMTNQQLIEVGRKVFNPLPGSQIGAKGYLGARIQPNSPTDNVEDIRWQVLDAWAYAVGDVLLGTNPVSSDPKSVEAIERTLQDLLTTFGINDLMPHCVLSHIDVQAEVEEASPGSTELWFQSIAGVDSANATFDISIEKMMRYASQRSGRFGLYFETGQGADFTNGHSHGFDMVMHESRKYGFARTLTREVERAQVAAGRTSAPWVHLNDVAGFIGPEVFRTREQLVRCCLEDIVMGKLHGLCIGLDVCSTLHMDVSLDDLDWCLDQIMPANPAYLMALPTKIDPMLGYLTTGYHDHVRLREKFGYRLNDAMWRFFRTLDIIDANGRPTEHFGDPVWVYLQYRRKKNDARTDQEIRNEGRRMISEIRGRGVFVAEGHGDQSWQLPQNLDLEIRRIYDDSKICLWEELDPEFINRVPDVLRLTTRSADRQDYILHPESGEQLTDDSIARLRDLKTHHSGRFNVQIVVSDGLNALAISDTGHLAQFLERLRDELSGHGLLAAPEHIVLTSGRVRAGYRIGEMLFGGLENHRVILHVIGERPGTGHHTFSTYITAPRGAVWSENGKVDHNITKVVSGIALTALKPQAGADEVVRILQTMLS